MAAVNPEKEHDHTEVIEYCFGDRPQSDITEDYIWAFIVGAVDFFREVRGKL